LGQLFRLLLGPRRGPEGGQDGAWRFGTAV